MGKFSAALEDEAAGAKHSYWQGKIGGVDVHLQSLPLTPADFENVGRKHNGWHLEPSFAAMVAAIILKARDVEDGEKAFDLKDQPKLMRVGSELIGEIFGSLFGGQFDDTEEDHEGRVKK